jgi:tetratricopeptide (TPR) repeat protein
MTSGVTEQRETLWAGLLRKWPRSLFWRLLTCVPGVLGFLIPVFMDKASPEAVRLGSGLGILGLVLPAWMAIYVPLKDKRQSLLAARDEVLEPLRYRRDTTDPLKWLLPRWSRSLVYGRQSTDKKLDVWLDSPSPVMVIDGGPLVGKTRMAIEWADSLGPEWEAGWLSPNKESEAVKRIAAYGKNTVIVVDGVPPHLAELIHDLGRHKSPPDIRVLLTVRHVQGIRISDQYDAAMIDEVQPLHLGPLGDTGDRERWFEELCLHYAYRLNTPIPPPSPAFIRELGVMPIGVLHTAALAAALTGAVPHPSQGVQEIMYGLWKTEVKSWRTMPGVPGSGRDEVSDAQLERLEHSVVALSLLAPPNREEAVKALGRIPTLSGTAIETQRDIVAWVTRTFPPTTVSGPAVLEFSPGIITVAAFLQLAHDNRNFGHTLLGSLTDPEASAVLERLVGAASLLPSTVAWATLAVDNNPARLKSAIDMTLAAAPTNPVLDRELVRSTERCGLDEVQTIALQQSIPRGSLPMVRVAIGQLRVKQLRTRVSDISGKYEPDLARALRNLAGELGEGGGRAVEALSAADESVTIYQRLAADNPAQYEPDLAAALNTLAVELVQAGGRTADAVEAVQESVTIWRRLATDNPAQHEPDLAMALNNLANILAAAGGRTADAVEALQKSVTIWRRLATDNPAQFEPGLARVLINLAGRLVEAGVRTAEALSAGQESVTIYQRLAAGNPARYEPDLAAALINLANALDDAGGRTADALEAVQSSVTIWRRLATHNPALHEPELAKALNILGTLLSKTGGRTADALEAVQSSVTIWRRLATHNPALHEPDLAGTLHNLAALLAEARGRTADALKAVQNSVTIWRRLATDNPALHEPNLAQALSNLASRLVETGGSTAEALEAGHQSLTIYRRFAIENPALYEPELALTLNNLAIDFGKAGMKNEATAYWRELLHIYERLARHDSRFNEPLARVERTIWEQTQLP